MRGKVPSTSAFAGWAAAGLGAGILVLLFRRLAEFPALHVDEAWTGLFALRIMDQGLTTPHEMNDYTGPLYPWLLSKVFASFGSGMSPLRLPGTLLNAAALLAMAAHLGRRFGSLSALTWLGLFASSAVFMLKSRLAWEVYALQPALLVVIYVTLRRFLDLKDRSFVNAAVFLSASLVGVQNHFIFISVPLSLMAGSAAALLLRKDPDARALCVLAAVNLLMTSAFFLAKRPMTDAFWLAHKGGLAALFLAGPLLFAGFYRLLDDSLARHVERLFDASALARPSFHKGLRVILTAGLALFFLFHWSALIQICSGVAVFKRLTSWTPPLPAEVLLYAWAALLLGALFWAMLTLWKPSEYRGLGPYERLVVFWPLAYACVFSLFRNTNSIRYYLLMNYMFLAAMAVVLPRLPALRRPRLLVPVACGAIVLVSLIWRESGPGPERRPFIFRVGWHKENSFHFARKDAVYRLAESEGACVVSDREPTIGLPVLFHMAAHKDLCRPGKTFDAAYMVFSTRPPFVGGGVK